MELPSTKPYLLRAIWEWCCDNGFTPHIAVQVDARTRVPREFIRDGQIVLNIGPEASNKLFDADKQPSETTKSIMSFCEGFEQAIARTKSFMEELGKLDLLMEGQAQIQNPGMDQPATFAGFRMIDEKKLQNIRGDQARKMVQNGMLGLVYAHLFSLSNMRVLFGMMNPELKA